MTEAIAGLLFCGSGLVLLVYCISLITDALESRRWPKTQGVIVDVGVESSAAIDGGRLHKLKVAYRFGERAEMLGTRVYFGDSMLVPRWALRGGRWPPYTAGDVVDVFCDPSPPFDSVLQPGVTPVLVLATCGALTITLIGAVLILGVT